MKYKVGDVLRIKDNGYSYTTYGDMFEMLNFRKKTLNSELPNGTIVQVFASAIHTYQDLEVYACVNEHGDETLISIEGLEEFSWKRAESYTVDGVSIEITESEIIINGTKIVRHGDTKSGGSGKESNGKVRPA
jgi:hypothetical protein